MYDKEKGIYPAGQYLVGRDIPLGGYVLTARDGKTAYVQLYPSMQSIKKRMMPSHIRISQTTIIFL